jgi:effector-binding domain-containing protein
MPKMSHVLLFEQKEQHCISVRTRVSTENLPKVIGENYDKLFGYLEEEGVLPTEAPFVAYYNMDYQNLDVEIGVPVGKKLSGLGEIVSSTIPSGKAIFCMYRGPYSEIGEVYEDMAKWIESHGEKAVGTAYEYYYNDFDFPESELLTKVVMPLKS